MTEGVKLSTVEDALKAKAWQSVADLADRALAQGKWKRHEEAFLYYARTRSLSNMDQYTAALDPGQRAITLAEQAKAWNILGLSLIEMAWVQRKIDGLQAQALDTISRYFTYFPRYGTEAASRYLLAMFSKGVCLRSAGHHAEALEQFKKTYEDALKRHENAWANRARGDAVNEALLLGEIALAEDLVNQGAEYIARHTDDNEAVASYLIDQAYLSLLKGDFAEAKGRAQEAADRAAKIPLLASQAFDLLHQIARTEGKNFAALATAIIAKIEAEEDQRPELIAKLGNSIQEIALRDPEAAEQFIRSLTQTGQHR